MNRPLKNRPLKVLMIAPTSFFSDYGGHIRILEETLALQNLGHQITIVTYYKGSDVTGLDIQRTKALPWRADYEVGSSRHKLAFDLYLIAKVIQVGRNIRPDIIHGHMHEGALIGSILSRLLGVPLVFDYQGSLTGEMVDHHFLNKNGIIYPVLRRFEKMIDHMPDAILTSSSRAQTVLQDSFDVPKNTIHPLPDCVDTKRFDPLRFPELERSRLKKELGIPLDRPVLAYLGLLADYQGTDHIIKAAHLLFKRGEAVHFLIMGYPRVNYYKAYAERMGVADRVTFTGKVAYEEAPRYLSLGDIAISAKISATEGSGKVLNYMAMQQPVVASDTAVHREYLDEYGLYVSPGDIEAIANHISAIISNPDQRKSLGAELRNRAVERFSWNAAGDKIDGLYKAILAQHE
jgi:glycosyltransferase involved in cell wall biosynthesis